jgi:hypothetical protein
MSEDQASSTKKIYINLLNEGTDVLRPADALEVAPNIYKILEQRNYKPEDEEWEFLPGMTVECKIEIRGREKLLVAKKKVG